MALTKVSRGLLSTGIVDNSNATAITLNADESVTFSGGVDVSGKVRVGASTNGTAASMTFDSASNSSALQMGNNSGGVYPGGVLLYSSSSNEFQIYQYSGVVGSETYGGPTFALNSLGGATFNPSGLGFAVFNESGVDADFRVESDSNANMLFVDGGANHVNIGTSSDYGGALNVNGGLNSKQAVFTSTNNRGLALSTASRSGQNDGVAIIDAQDTEATGGRLELHTMGAERARFERDQIVFNEGSNNQDFRVESDTNANAIFVDAGAGTVSLGTAGGYKAEFESNGDGVRIVTDNTAHTIGLVSGNSFASGADYTWCKATGGASGNFDISVNTLGVRLGRNSTSWASLSDSRLKTVTGRYTDAITDVKELDPVKFTWNNDPKNSPNVGFLAQSVQGVVPEAVTSDQKIDGDDTEYLSVKYTEVIPLLTAAVQEAITKIETLEARITALES